MAESFQRFLSHSTHDRPWCEIADAALGKEKGLLQALSQ
jgi:hypothetical protein